MSLRARLTIWVISVFVVLQLVTTMVILLYQRGALQRMFDQQLGVRASLMAERVTAALPSLDNEGLQRISREASAHVPFTSFRVMVVGRDGSDWTKSNLQWPAPVFSMALLTIASFDTGFTTIDTDWFANESYGRRSARVVAKPIRGTLGNPFALVIATSDDYVRSQEDIITRAFVVAGLLGLAATGISGWLIAGFATKPLRRFKQVASALGPTSISSEIQTPGSSSEVQELTTALNDARKRIRDAFAAQDRFLSNVSHELKTPIATLLVEAQTIDPRGLSEPAAHFVHTTEEEMRRLGRLIESFLTLTRIRDGKGATRIVRVHANDLIVESVAHCTAMARQHTVSLLPTLIESDSHTQAALSGDPDLLRTMVDNLIRNAIRFAPVSSAVGVTAYIDDKALMISVTDHGPGVPAAMLDRVFDPYTQAPEEHRQGRGYGLGLTIAQAVAELHGGTIKAINRPEGGAEFLARLPSLAAENGATSNGTGGEPSAPAP